MQNIYAHISIVAHHPDGYTISRIEAAKLKILNGKAKGQICFIKADEFTDPASRISIYSNQDAVIRPC